MTSVRDFFQDHVPHPYRRPLARVIFVPYLLVGLIVQAAYDAWNWCGGMAGEVVSAWKDIRDW